MLVDGAGNVRDGDDLIYILARDWQASGRLQGPVVGTLMSNFGLEQALGAAGIDFRRANVGDRYVHRMLIDNDGVLGGEASGHILCLDRSATGDGIVAALQVLEVMKRTGKPLARLLEGMQRVAQKTRNVRCTDAKRAVADPGVVAALEQARADVAGKGRAFLRPSGTEPVVRVTVEAADAALVDSTLDALARAVEKAV